MRSVTALPNLLTLGNAFCGLLAISKGIDALAFAGEHPLVFYSKLETACWLIFLGMVFDVLDGRVARMTGGASDFGAQIDSLADALTFGCAPALLAKVLLEHEGPVQGALGEPRLHFLAAAAFTLMAILRLARFNLETGPAESAHKSFRGLPSPAAAGAVVSAILFYLSMTRPEVELEDGMPTPLGRALALFPELAVNLPWWYLPGVAFMLPVLGFLMVSRVRYRHLTAALTRRGSFFALVYMVFGAFLFFAAPVPMVFIAFNGFVVLGIVRHFMARSRPQVPPYAGDPDSGDPDSGESDSGESDSGESGSSEPGEGALTGSARK